MAGFNKYYYLYRVKRGKAVANELPVKEVLNMFFKRYHIDYNPYEESIKQEWNSLTGNIISKFTQSIIMKKDTLYVTISSPTVKAELNMLRDAIKNRINENIGKTVVSNIIIR
ncbi:MAG: DUF721 domain-containing protein [Bacteroidales bacterium]|nr:DUF721 domain-containing protein [Bacteroidales bacterium]MBQ9311655.1 DUF721 domain-containing protein [Bacteroidales bacterium]